MEDMKLYTVCYSTDLFEEGEPQEVEATSRKEAVAEVREWLANNGVFPISIYAVEGEISEDDEE